MLGKTALVTNIACVFAEMGKRTLIVDTDGQGNASMTFGLNPDNIKDTVYDLMVGQKTAEDLIVKLGKNLDLIPANHDLNFLDFDVIGNIKKYPEPFTLLKQGLESIKDSYDYIIIDTPPALSLMAGNVLVSADRVLIPFLPEVYGVKGLIRIVKTLGEFKESHNPSLSIAGVIGMMVERNTILHSDIITQARQYCVKNDIAFFDTVIPNSIRYPSVTYYEKKPAVWSKDAKAKKIAEFYYELAKEVIEHG
ncbi:ParA family protein [Paenibacillus sp. NPDC093718]|uniref:ParA family protein n=1 Tax=Paenibacillus sp. NPDC093718 TaxID=3390601 RepID=UPI003CFEB678